MTTGSNLSVINHQTRDYWHDGEKYGNWTDDKHNNVQGLELVDGERYSDLPYHEKVKVGDYLYLVYVLYGSGDSFGHSSGEIEYIALYDNIEEANKAKESIVSFNDRNIDKLDIILSNGKRLEMSYVPWEGYFECLESVEVVKLEIT